MDYIKQTKANSFRRSPKRAPLKPGNIRQAAPRAVQASPKQEVLSKARKDVNISISLAVPTAFPAVFKNIAQKIKSVRIPSPVNLWKGRYSKIAIGSAVVIAAAFSLWQQFGPSIVPPNEQPAVQGAETAAPQFQPAVPENKKEIERKYYPDRKTFAFKDQVGGVEVVVSQQQLPETFKADPQVNVENFAKKSNFATPIEADGITAYAGKDVSGSQTVVFQKDGLLIFIYAVKELSTADLAAYIKILKI